MQNTTHHNFLNKDQIAERIIRRASALWGVKDPTNLDPIVKLLINVLAFEMASLGGEMVTHKGKMLEQLADLLVPGPWIIPQPAHALMTTQPLEASTTLKTIHQFYIPLREKPISGEEVVKDQYFSPLKDTLLIKAQAEVQLTEDSVIYSLGPGQEMEDPASLHDTIAPQEIWIGIQTDNSLSQLEEFSLFIDLPISSDNKAILLEQVTYFTSDGKPLSATPFRLQDQKFEDTHFSDNSFLQSQPENTILKDIAGCYEQRVFTLRDPKGHINVEKKSAPPSLKSRLTSMNPDLFATERFWVKACFPAAFSQKDIRHTKIILNPVPIINRRLNPGQIRIHEGKNIIPLRLPDEGSLFYIEQVSDDKGQQYHHQNPGTSESHSGSYSTYNGNLERFDKTTADAFLDKMIRLIQEESSVFTAFGQDIMLKQMSQLRKDLKAIEKQISNAGSLKNTIKNFLLIDPLPETSRLEFDYWSVSKIWEGLKIEKGTPVSQYKEIIVVPGSSSLITNLIPGKSIQDTREKIRAFQYGMMTRDRIVSKSDIRQFLFHHLGQWIKQIQISNGVAISPDKKRGLVRTVDIIIEPLPNNPLSPKDWGILLTGFQANLNRRSIHLAEYQLRLTNTNQKPS